MKIKAQQLISDLEALTQKHLEYAVFLNNKSKEELSLKANPQSWNTLECLEHLNLYGNFYLPEIETRLRNNKNHPSKELFKSGFLGNYFAESLWPKEKASKMKTLKKTNPINQNLDKQVIENFISQQHKMLSLLKEARTADLNKVKTSISISKWIKLKLGDTLRVVIYHNERHLKQAERILKETQPIL